MTATPFDMTETIAARSDQQNYDDFIGGVTRTVTVAEVRGGSAEQPVDIHLVEYPGKCYRPSKSMRRVLVMAWGPDASVYVGRKMLLYGDPTVKFGGATVGGIKIGALSHIDKPLDLKLTSTRGKRDRHTVEVLKDEPTPTSATHTDVIAKMVTAFNAIGVDVPQIEQRLGKPRAQWDAGDVATAKGFYAELKARPSESSEQPTLDSDAPQQVTEETLLDLAQAAEGRKPDEWRAWVNETVGREVKSDTELTEREAGDLLALLGAEAGK